MRRRTTGDRIWQAVRAFVLAMAVSVLLDLVIWPALGWRPPLAAAVVLGVVIVVGAYWLVLELDAHGQRGQ